MTRGRFSKLRGMLPFVHITQTASPTENRLLRVEPIVNSFRKACLEMLRPEVLSGDEQMVPFSGRSLARQYEPSKPHSVGLKNFILSSSDWLVLDFLIYTSKRTFSDTDKNELGLGGEVVKHLQETVPMDHPVHVFSGRFLTGMTLEKFLPKRNAYLAGKYVANRTRGAASKLPSENNRNHGESCSVVSSDGEMCNRSKISHQKIRKWNDHKSVMILSSAFGINPEGTCRRGSIEKQKQKVDIPQPYCVKAYNKNMDDWTLWTGTFLITGQRSLQRGGP
ncbi:hypothetical protein HPB48_017469 [Haemaphysalis longicornis]|uniref:PiggyBac transposable element-derived protein domain-containing protein n=1 Tax=Haemaphysalis longicornis TaxID=44386 RepID=A0A9J6FSF7_HAELO|nr:hypothetical protein HPB48_017469 [Haemaphysalis longicornis]